MHEHYARIIYRKPAQYVDALGFGVTLVGGWCAGNLIHPDNHGDELFLQTSFMHTLSHYEKTNAFAGNNLHGALKYPLDPTGKPPREAIASMGNFLIRGPFTAKDGTPLCLIFGFILGNFASDDQDVLAAGIVRLTCRDQKSPKQERSLRCRDCIPPFARRRGSESSQR